MLGYGSCAWLVCALNFVVVVYGFGLGLVLHRLVCWLVIVAVSGVFGASILVCIFGLGFWDLCWVWLMWLLLSALLVGGLLVVILV